MSKITKTQKYAIQWLDSTGMNIQDISKELKITSDQVASILESSKQPAAIETKSKNLMITHTSGKKINSVAIMTKEASEVSDDLKKNLPNAVANTKTKGIFRPKK